MPRVRRLLARASSIRVYRLPVSNPCFLSIASTALPAITAAASGACKVRTLAAENVRAGSGMSSCAVLASGKMPVIKCSGLPPEQPYRSRQNRMKHIHIDAQYSFSRESVRGVGPMLAHTDVKLGSAMLAPRAGFEPATIRLTVECSTAELPRNRRKPCSHAGAYNKGLERCKGPNMLVPGRRKARRNRCLAVQFLPWSRLAAPRHKLSRRPRKWLIPLPACTGVAFGQSLYQR